MEKRTTENQKKPSKPGFQFGDLKKIATTDYIGSNEWGEFASTTGWADPSSPDMKGRRNDYFLELSGGGGSGSSSGGGSGSGSSPSDIRLKDEISPMQAALEKLLQLQGVQFSWKENQSRDLGFVAQNVESIFPELVELSDSTDETSIKRVRYGHLTAVIVEALREMKAKHEHEISTLMDRIEKLERKLGH
ncbi:MAG: tail fiber domain-containing protein [Bdellovibrionales bacterium]|nr:tail fiber domain-containing protein [Bdellovibrionales bacterium]